MGNWGELGGIGVTMKSENPIYFSDPEQLVDYVIDKVGKSIVLGMCLGLGKPNHFANAIYKRALGDPSLHIKILTALSLEPPTWSSDLEQRFLEPLVNRVWKGYVNLDYITAVRKKELPPNVEVSEFFYKAGGFLDNEHMQQNYTSTNYTHAARDVRDNGMNVGGQLVAKRELNGKPMFSMSSNSDTALDAFRILQKQKKEGRKVVAVGQVNNNLPFMYGDAVVSPDLFDAVLEGPDFHFSLFGAPRESINATDYVIGLHASTLIKDGGTLQIGIGSLGDAIAYGLLLRHQQNEEYNNILSDAGATDRYGDIIRRVGGNAAFDKGLYGSTEMLVDAFLHLYKAGIMKRKVYDDVSLQQLLNEEKITVKQKITRELVEMLQERSAIHSRLTKKDFSFLQKYGILKPGLKYKDGEIVDGNESFSPDLNDANSKDRLFESCLGSELVDGFWMHAGFFLGPPDFYDVLNNMSEEERAQINMTSVLHTNQLYGNNPYASEELKVLQRKDARFINAGLMVTLSGAVVSDGLEDLRVVSGVGGQYNFVSQAHALEDARSVLMIRSTRAKGGDVGSNIVFNYGHTTIPRHLRDIIITEYGIADLRGKSDKQVIAALLNITDSRFQEGLLERARQSKKIPSDYKIPDQFKYNYPEAIDDTLFPYKKKNLFPPFPFGTSFTDEEITLGKSLRSFKEKAAENKMAILPKLAGQILSSVPVEAKPYLERMNLDNPSNRQEKMMQKVVILALKQAGQI